MARRWKAASAVCQVTGHCPSCHWLPKGVVQSIPAGIGLDQQPLPLSGDKATQATRNQQILPSEKGSSSPSAADLKCISTPHTAHRQNHGTVWAGRALQAHPSAAPAVGRDTHRAQAGLESCQQDWGGCGQHLGSLHTLISVPRQGRSCRAEQTAPAWQQPPTARQCKPFTLPCTQHSNSAQALPPAQESLGWSHPGIKNLHIYHRQQIKTKLCLCKRGFSITVSRNG